MAASLFAGGLAVAFLLAEREFIDASVAVLVVAIGASAFAFQSVLVHQLRITEFAEKTLFGLQARYDSLRSDSRLLEIFAGNVDPSLLSEADRIRLRLFVASLLQMYSLIIHYIRRGYFRRDVRFAQVYETHLRSLLAISSVRALWCAEGAWGPGKLRDELGLDVQTIIDAIVGDERQAATM
jgi:hypothetical protein